MRRLSLRSFPLAVIGSLALCSTLDPPATLQASPAEVWPGERAPLGHAFSLAQSPRALAHATLPAKASEPTVVRSTSSPLGLGFRLRGAQETVAHLDADRVRYPEALGEGTEVELRELADGVEDRVRFARAPEGEGVTYEVDVRRVAGVRQVGSVVEFVDEQGAPRLRMGAPWVETSTGERVAARVEVGCAHDESTRVPWGRAVVSPGVETCAIRVSWGGRGVTYPAVLDPTWTSTTGMSESRGNMAFTLMSGGRLIVAGGRNCQAGMCLPIALTEIFDPASETWAVVGDLSVPRDRFSAVDVPGKGVIVAGGDLASDSSTTAELFDEPSGTWKLLAPMPRPRADMAMQLLADQHTLALIGGIDLNGDTAVAPIDLYDATTNTWSDGGTLLQGRFWTVASLLADGRMVVSGGTTCPNCGPIKTVELYDPKAKMSASLPPMVTGRLGHSVIHANLGGADSLLAIGGGTSKVEIFDLGKKTWAPGPSMKDNRAFFAAILQPDSTVLVAGGGSVPSFSAIAGVERLDLTTLTWTQAAPMLNARALAASAQLSGARVLVAGGVKGSIVSTGSTILEAEIFQALPLAAPCTASGECTSGFCVDGVCCESACGGLCQACSAAKKGSGADGVCGFLGAGSDPDDDCPTDDPSTCGRSGSCDGKGECARYPVGAACGPSSCTDGVSSGLLCGADGKCAAQNVPCAPFLCQGATCGATCVSDGECAVEGHCEQGVCVGDGAVGTACDRASACASGFCVDGVCCESACEGVCQACLGEKKEGGGADGVCGFAKVDSDPHEDCADEPVESCDRTGSCDGKGACALHAKGTICQMPTCVIDADRVRVDSYRCDGSGTCGAQESESCGLFGCEQGTCKESCAQDADCAPRAYCDGGVCLERRALGALCQQGNECGTGFCVDGVCCGSVCDGQCEACDVDKALGYCVPVSGAPHNQRVPCASDEPGQVCAQRVCDGIDRQSCQGHVGTTTVCRSPSCAEGVAVLAATCDGKGQCPALEQLPCEPFVCQGAVCLARCDRNEDCSENFRCDLAKHDCVAKTGAFCQDEHTLIQPDGSPEECAPYRCEGSACKSACSSVLDCAQPSICDEETRRCVPPQENPSADGGCQAAPGPLSSGWPLLLLGLFVRRRPRLERPQPKN